MSESDSQVLIRIPDKLVPVFQGDYRYRGAYGGRGSGKTRTFALMAAIWGYKLSTQGKEGLIIGAREFMNSLEDSSMAEIKSVINDHEWLADHYNIGEKFIRTKDGLIEFAFIGLRHNLDSIKSKSRIHLLWIDEAEPVTETAWLKAIPTVREHGSEIWVTWNPESKHSATNKRFRENPPEDSCIVQVNWQDNPYFPEVLEKERQRDFKLRPEHYAHIWEGDYVTAIEGAYFTYYINQAKAEGRIGKVPPDPMMQYRAFWDIGGTGAKADATAIWIAQWIDLEIRILDYYEAQGQPLATHVNWLRQNGYDTALMYLPHDGSSHDKVYNTSFESALVNAGFSVQVVPNQGTGAARSRIEAVRRLFTAMWFNDEKCEHGLEALGWYHEKRDERRDIGLGPNHDWSSHCADAFGLMCIAYEAPQMKQMQQRYMNNSGNYGISNSWMAR